MNIFYLNQKCVNGISIFVLTLLFGLMSIVSFSSENNLNRKINPEFFKERYLKYCTSVYELNDTIPSGRETDIWFMGLNGIDWSADTPRVVTGFNTTGWDPSQEAHTSICDRTGKLVLYTDNVYVYNGSHQIITNIQGGSSSSMILILPQPGNDSIYYIFHPDQVGGNLNNPYNGKLFMSIININGNNLKGAVIVKNMPLMQGSSEKVTGIRHCNNKDWWVLGLRSEDEAFHSWLLTDTGLVMSNPVVSFSGNLHNDRLNSKYQNVGYLKPSPDGSMLAEISYGYNYSQNKNKYGILELHKFDPSSGIIYGGIEIFSDIVDFVLYSAEFSADNSKLYVPELQRRPTDNRLFQLDLCPWNKNSIINSKFTLLLGKSIYGSPVLGKNKKIYITDFDKKLMHVIHQPNKKGLLCDLRSFDFDLGANSELGVPLFPSGLQFPKGFKIQGPDSLCLDSIAQYQLSDLGCHANTIWSLPDGGVIKKQDGDIIEIDFQSTGTKRLIASYPTACGDQSDTLRIVIKNCNCNPYFQWLAIDTLICKGSSAEFKFNSNADSISINNRFYIKDSFTISGFDIDSCMQVKLYFDAFCDSTFMLCIKQLPNTRVFSDTLSFCEGDSILIGHNWYKDAATITLHDINHLGCDSTTILQLIINSSNEINIQQTGCDSFNWSGITYDKSGSYPHQTTNMSGCDSTTTLELVINVSTRSTTIFNTCESLNWNGQTYTQSGTYRYDTINRFGCDSTATLQLNINSVINAKVSDAACDSYAWNGNTYTQSGSYQYKTVNGVGCDSITTLQLTIHGSTNSTTATTACDSYTWNGQTYTQSGNYQYQTKNAAGCDSIATLNLTINKSDDHKIDRIACNSYLWNGITYSQSGNYQYKTVNVHGCDSIINLNLNIRSEQHNNAVSQCDSFTWNVNGQLYNQSGVYLQKYTNSFGCDSIHTLDLNIYQSYDLLQQAKACTQYLWPVNNAVLTKSGEYTIPLKTVEGCDSVIRLNLIVNPDFKKTDTVITNIAYTWPINQKIYATSGIYEEDFTSSEDCDSIHLLYLVIKKDIGIYYPNVINPNGIDRNTKFTLFDKGHTIASINSLSIYDRWGNLLWQKQHFAANDVDLGWNGKCNGQNVLPGVYVWHAQLALTDGSTVSEKGDVTVTR